jgi:pyruvate formate lyase activating enzyme
MKRHGMIFDIKQVAVHDGPGIRTTVFFKGCSLSCWWCHNPEGISPTPEIFSHHYKCINCGMCDDVCTEHAIEQIEDGVSIQREKCTVCGRCAEICPTGALRMVGRDILVDGVMEEIGKSRLYYDFSGGGVTFSGGEPLMQPQFLKRLLKECQDEGIHTALDTSGYASPRIFASILKEVDLFLYDLKIWNDENHKKYTGGSNVEIIKNIQTLTRKRKDLIIRFPVIPEITGTKENVANILDLVSSLTIQRIDLLPFHDVEEKYDRLGKEWKMKGTCAPSEELLKDISKKIEDNGIPVKIGG